MDYLYSLADYQHIYEISGFTGIYLYVLAILSPLISVLAWGYFSQPGFNVWLKKIVPLFLLLGIPSSAFYWEVSNQKNRLSRFLENKDSMEYFSVKGRFSYSKLGEHFFFSLDEKEFVVVTHYLPYGCNNEHLFTAIKEAVSKKVRVTLMVYSDKYQERKEDIEHFVNDRHINHEEPLFISACVSSIEVIS